MQYLSTEQKSPMLSEQEDIQFIKTQLINNLFCIVNLDREINFVILLFESKMFPLRFCLFTLFRNGGPDHPTVASSII